MVSEGSTSSVIVFPVSVLTKICFKLCVYKYRMSVSVLLRAENGENRTRDENMHDVQRREESGRFRTLSEK